MIISQQDYTSEAVISTLKNLGFESISVFSSGNEARRILRNGNYPDFIIINTPLSDEFGSEFAETAAEETDSKIILLCQRDISDMLADNLSTFDVLVLSKPLGHDELREAVQFAGPEISLFQDVRETSEVLKRINDIRIVSKAKSTLMKYLHFTEPQAHRYLEKQAMNNRCSRRETAEQIIRNYNE